MNRVIFIRTLEELQDQAQDLFKLEHDGEIGQPKDVYKRLADLIEDIETDFGNEFQ